MGDANNIRKYRKLLGLTQEQLADASGLSLMSIRRYEAGDRRPSAKAVKALCEGFSKYLFEITPQELMNIRPLNTENRSDGIALELYCAYEQLNEEGKQKALERVVELTEIPRYKREKE